MTSPTSEMPVYLVEYDATWPARFAEERRRIASVLADYSPDIEHIGSTAIPGIAAKPIIDIMALIDDIADAPDCIRRLGALEYHYHAYKEDICPERRWFCKPNPADRTHHLHLVQRDTPFHADHLLFLDYLRTHATTARRYENLKRDLATRFPDDREGYTDGKSEFVAEILASARAFTSD